MMHVHQFLNLKSIASTTLLSLSLLLNGCSIGPSPQDAVMKYDLGPPQIREKADVRVKATLMVPAAAAPAWLDSPGIVYRLAYLDAARPQTYAQSRWVDSPAALLTQRVRSRFAAVGPVVSGGEGVRADYALQIEIEDFSQSFGATDHSKVSVRVRATLVDLSNRKLHAQRTFSMEQSAAPDAEGAARGLAQAADAVIERLLEWTEQGLKSG